MIRRFVLAALLAATSMNVAQGSDEKRAIILYDLRYTLEIDYDDPEQVNRTWDHCHVVAVLQGIVNRDNPRLYLRYVDSRYARKNVDDYWLTMYRAEGEWLAGRGVRQIKTLEDLIEHFKGEINGLVVYDSNVPATSNVGSGVAGAEDLIAVRYDLSEGSVYRLMTERLKLPVKVWLINRDGSSLFTGEGRIPGSKRYTTGSSKCDAYIWMKEHYLDSGKLNPEFGAYYLDYFWSQRPKAAARNHHTLTNHDFFVSSRAWFFDLNVWEDEAATDDPDQIPGTDRRTLNELLLSAYRGVDGKKMIHVGGFPPWAHKYTTTAGDRHPDVSTEWEYVLILSAYNAFKDADAIGYGAMANASFWQHFPLKDEYPQEWVTREELKKRGYLTEGGQVDFKDREFIIFYVGDYDAAAWMYQRMIDIWDDPNRGKVPLMWCFSPILEVRAPMAMHYVRKTATANDYFAAANNGAGYLNPGALRYARWLPEERIISGLPSGLPLWQAHCKKYYDRWGLTITGFIIDGFAESMGKDELDCYREFSPNGIVWHKGALTYLHDGMPVLRSDIDVNDSDPEAAVEMIVKRVGERTIRFHWFRNILKSPTWYLRVVEGLKEKDERIELLDAPTFFALYKIYLENNPDAAAGKYPYFESLWFR